MNSEDGFEKRLRDLPPRRVPASWRSEILGALPEVTRTNPAPKPGIGDLLRALLWPNPQAWAGLGAAWVLSLGLTLAIQEPSGMQTGQRWTRPSPQVRELLRQQDQLMAELSDPVDFYERRQTQPVAPKPQSFLQCETFKA